MNQRNSQKVVWIETKLHRATEMEGCLPPSTGNYRDATNRVPAISMFAGQPDEFTQADRDFRATAWKVIAVVLTILWATFTAGVIVGFQK